MTADEIRAAIAADPALQALVPDTQAIADALSVGRTRWKHTDIGVGTIIEALGLAAANPVLDALYASPDYRHVKPLLDEGRLRLDVVADQAACVIVAVSGNRVGGGIARADAGQEQQVADAVRVRVMAHGLGRAAGMDAATAMPPSMQRPSKPFLLGTTRLLLS